MTLQSPGSHDPVQLLAKLAHLLNFQDPLELLYRGSTGLDLKATLFCLIGRLIIGRLTVMTVSSRCLAARSLLGGQRDPGAEVLH